MQVKKNKNASNLQQAQVVQEVPQSACPMNQTTTSELHLKTDCKVKVHSL